MSQSADRPLTEWRAEFPGGDWLQLCFTSVPVQLSPPSHLAPQQIMENENCDETQLSGSDSEVSEAHYSSSSITLSDTSSERSMSDKSVQTDLEVEPLRRTKYSPTCVNVNLTYQDRVSLWVDGRPVSPVINNDNDHLKPQPQIQENKNFVVIAGKEKVTLRINPGRQERRLSDATLYEDIEEASEWLSEEYLRSLQAVPPPLPPRHLTTGSEFNGEISVRRKNLNHLLGIDEQLDLNILRRNNANINAVRNLQEKGRVRNKKDLTKFLGINDVKLRKKPQNRNNVDRQRKSKSVIENIFQASKHRKSAKDCLDQSRLQESFNQSEGDQDQGRWEKINPEKRPVESRRDVTRIEDSDHLKTSLRIVCGNENDEKEVSNKDLAYDKSRTSSFSSVSSTRSSSSSKESLTEKSAFSKLFRHSSRRFSTSGIELMQSLRLKSNSAGKYQPSSLIDISTESQSSSDTPYHDRSYIEEFIARGMPVIPFDQPLMALMDSKHEKVGKKNVQRREEDLDYTSSVSDSLDTLIKLAQQQLSTSSYSANEEPIYIEMTKASSSLSNKNNNNNNDFTKPNYNEYMDMDVVQTALSSFKFN